MLQIINITKQWQIYLPDEIRKKSGIKKPGQVQIVAQKNKIVITPKKSSVLSLAGKYKKVKPTRKINLNKIRDHIDYSDL